MASFLQPNGEELTRTEILAVTIASTFAAISGLIFAIVFCAGKRKEKKAVEAAPVEMAKASSPQTSMRKSFSEDSTNDSEKEMSIKMNGPTVYTTPSPPLK